VLPDPGQRHRATDDGGQSTSILTGLELEHMIYSHAERRSATVRVTGAGITPDVKGASFVAMHTDLVAPLPPPSAEQAAALETVRAYLTQAGTQVASCLLGCPPLTSETATLAELSTQMLRGAALCEGLLELADEQLRR
jgi:hypothetical protein